MPDKIKVLIVDDEAFVRDSLAEMLQAEGMRTFTADGARAAIDFLAKKRVDVIVTDLRMPSGDGMQLLEESRSSGAAIPILVITGVGTVGEAVRAIKAGAFDFLQKPVDPDELAVLVRRAADHKRLVSEVATLRTEAAGRRATRRLVGSSQPMSRVRAAIAQVAPTDAVVLLSGEAGTGKELAAEEIHRAGHRARGPLVLVNCSLLTDELGESELFGHKRGALAGAVADRAGRFAEAEGGTLVLDEVGALRPSVQAKLARTLETGEYEVVGDPRTRQADVRVVAITNEDLALRAKAGTFRPDLYYRLSVFPITLPPLREHKDDLREIADHVLASAARRGSAPPPAVGQDALEVLLSYDWPGNVRELRNVLERAAIVSEGAELAAEVIRDILETNPSSRRALPGAEFNLRRNLDQLERSLVLRAITSTKGKKREACDLLGIDARNLGYYIRKHKISDDEVRAASQA